MSKICLIRQPSGLGDIIFTLKIANYYKNLGYDIWWPVISEFTWISDYIDGYNFYDKGDSSYKTPLLSNDRFREIYNSTNPVFTDDFVYLPLQFADQLVPNCRIMESKYKLLNMDYSDWSEHFNLNRSKIKEDELYYNVLGLKDDEKYCFISKNYGSPPFFASFPIKYEGDLKIVEMNFIKNFSLFDWSKVIENASEIHTLDSSINYLIDKLTLKTENIFLHTKPGCETARPLFKTNYKKVIYN